VKTIARLAAAIVWLLAPAIAQAAQPWDTTDLTGDLQQKDEIAVAPADEIVGKSVVDRNGNAAGRVLSLVIDSASGEIKYVLIEGSPNFDLGGYLVAVPWPLMTVGSDARTIAVSVTADELHHAPLIDRSLVYQLVASSSQTRRYGYWGYPRGVDPYGYADLGPGDPYRPAFPRANPCARLPEPLGTKKERGRCDRLTELERQTGDQGRQVQTDHVAPAKITATVNRKPTDRRQNQNHQTPAVAADRSSKSQQVPKNHRSGSIDRLIVDQNSIFSALTAPTTTSASGLTSADVYSENGSLIGRIDQVVIDIKHGDIAYLRLRRQGSSGHNPTRLAIPVQALTWARHDPGDYRLRVSERLLRNTPSLGADGKSQSGFISKRKVAELYAHFRMTPYWQTPSDGTAHRPHSA
jgi:sporulation protein YlmC with PRC-barrel domain